MLIKKYNIIGDIHCRKVWKELVKDDCINIFVGDYFSPYDEYPFDEQIGNFMDIIKYKMEHPETILLIGNHDDQHWKNIDRYVSRFNHEHANEIKEVFEENKDFLQVAYSIENKILVTHAGVTMSWYGRYAFKQEYTDLYVIDNKEFPDVKSAEEGLMAFIEKNAPYFSNDVKETYKKNCCIVWNDILWKYSEENGKFVELNLTPDEVADFVNEQWESGNTKCFSFEANAKFSDYYGTTLTHGPLWVRSKSLLIDNIFKGREYYQVVGHTMSPFITDEQRLYFVDVLEKKQQSLIITIDNNEIKFETNELGKN